MKKILALSCLFFILSCHLRRDSVYLSKISTLPSFDLQLMDGVTMFHASDIPGGKPILMIYFRPDCPHCQFETKTLINNIDRMKNFRIYFVTGASISDAKDYAHYFHLDQYSEIITLGKDHEHSFMRVFQPISIPFLAIYNEQKKLVKVYHGEVPVTNLIAAWHS